MSAPVTIAKHHSEVQALPFKVDDAITLSAFRAIAEKEGIMTAKDLFITGNSGISLPKNREERLTWSEIQDLENNSVHINVGGKDFSMKDGLTDREKVALLQKSHIGFGFDTSGEEGPRYTNRQVVASLPISRIAYTLYEEGEHDVISTSSSLHSAFLQAGWVSASLAAKTPWVDVGLHGSFSQSSATSDSQAHIYVTGRYNYTYGTVSMMDYVSQLKPHPEFQKAITNALAITNELDRIQEIKKVLSWYGTMFVTSVEVGGMKHSTIEKILDAKTTEASVKAEMSITLGKKFGPAKVGASVEGGMATTQTQQQESEFDSLTFHTVGGTIEAHSISEWRASLSSPLKWGVTRVLEVQSVLSLFDKETQAKIALAALHVPIYQFRNYTGKHCLSTDPDPSKIIVNSEGAWANCGVLGIGLTVPLDGARPIWHIYDGRHTYTADLAEKNRLVPGAGFRDMGILCYAYLTQKSGTIPLNRLWQPTFVDTAHESTNEGIEAQKRYGYSVDGTKYYV